MIALVCILSLLIGFGLYRGFREVTFAAHRWRGLGWGADLIDHFLILGFVTVHWSKQRLSDRIRELNEALNSFRKDGQ